MLNFATTISPPITNVLMELAKSRPSPNIQQLLADTQKRIGDIVEALVEKVIPLSEKQQKQVRTQLPTQPSTQLSTLAQQPLKALLLRIVGSDKPLLTVSDQEVQKNQRLPVKITPVGLEILSKPAKTQPASASTRPTIPAAAPLGRLLEQIIQSSRNLPLTKSLQPIVEKLNQTIVSREQLLQPAQLKAAIKRSGVLRENITPRAATAEGNPNSKGGEITSLLRSTAPDRLTRIFKPTVTRAASELNRVPESKVVRPEVQVLASKTVTPLPQKNAAPAPSPNVNSVPSDLKSTLIELQRLITNSVSQVERHSEVHRFAANTTPSTPVFLADAIVAGNGKVSHKKNASVQEQLQQISLKINQAIARIQSQQINSLSQTRESNEASHNLQLDLPVKMGEQIHTLQLGLQYRWDREEDEDTESSKHKKSVKANGRWVATLAFDLDELGDVFAEVSASSDNVDVQFWAEKRSTFDLIRLREKRLLQQLDQAGIEVRQHRCHCGQPCERAIRLNYALVDITT